MEAHRVIHSSLPHDLKANSGRTDTALMVQLGLDQFVYDWKAVPYDQLVHVKSFVKPDLIFFNNGAGLM